MKRSYEDDVGIDDTSAYLPKRLRKQPKSLSSLSDEILLLVFSSLSAADVCNTQLVDRRFATLATDQLLWKGLYHAHHYGNKVRRPLSTSLAELSEKRKRRSLGHVNEADRVRKTAVDWKRRYQIRSNWSRGRCRSTKSRTVSSSSRMFADQEVSVIDSTVYVNDKERLVPNVSSISDILNVDKNLLLTANKEVIQLYDLTANAVRHVIRVSARQTCLFETGLLVLLNADNVLTIYHVDQEIKYLHKLRGHFNMTVKMQIRTLEDSLVLGLVYIDHGILDSSLCCQEFFISKSTLAFTQTRSTMSKPFARSRWHQHQDQQSQDRIAYHHPYVLVPNSNHINTYVIRSSPTKVAITGPQCLRGYGTTIESCQVQRALRFVVGSGEAGLKLWDLQSSDVGHSVGIPFNTHTDATQASYKELFSHGTYADSPGRISQIDESLIVATSETGWITTHDFTI